MGLRLRSPVLAATDLSAAAADALRQARAVAADLGATLVVCHVLPEAFRVRVLFPQDAGVDAAEERRLMEAARTAVRRWIESVQDVAGDASPLEIDAGTPHAGILAAAERVGAGLIVVGPGATALRVARSAPVPVLVARPSPAGGGVLGATDFSDPSLPALHMAAAEAKRRGVRFRVVHCLDIDQSASLPAAGMPGMITAPLSPSVIDRLERAAREQLAAALTQTAMMAEAAVLLRPPEVGILEAAQTESTALIVVGTRGRTGLARLALGSVAEGVIGQAPCSVLVVPLHPA